MKKRIIGIFILILITTFPIKVNAESCSNDVVNKFKKLKDNINITYTLLSEDEAKQKYDINSKNLYNINIYNIPKGLKIVSSGDDSITTNKTNEEYTNVLNSGWAFGGNEIIFSIYTTDDYSCFGYIGEIKVKLPWYNKYSESDFCKDNKDFKYCKKTLSIRITEKTFNNEVERYKNNLENKTVEKNDGDNNFLSLMMDNMLFIVTGVIILGLIIVLIIRKIKSKRSRLI